MSRIFLAVTLFVLASRVSALSKDDLPQGSKIILSALHDELDRNLSLLAYKDYSKPYYIAYNLSDVYSHQIVSSLGALVMSQPNHERANYVRLMVGDYELNDENFRDKTNASDHNDGYLPLPLDNDYLGIRRSYWLMTNNVYKNASELFKNKSDAMARKNLTKADMEAPDFSREKPQQYYKQPIQHSLDVSALQQKANEISAVFNAYPQIVESKVYIVYQNSTEYYINNEGTEMVLPQVFYKIAVVALTYTKENDLEGDFLAYYGEDMNNMPDVNQMKNDAKILADNLVQKSTIDPFTESYNGPVLISGKAVPEIIFQRLFYPGDGLIARRAPLINDTYSGILNSNRRTWEAKYGNKVIAKDLSIIDIPSITSYKNQPLFGAFDIDREGVVPPDSIVLIDKGILMAQLNDRTPTPKQLHSNGHNRNYIGLGSTSFAVSPSNVLIRAENTKPLQELKDELIKKAKEENLPYAVLIKPLETTSNYAPINYYKIDVETGEETLLRAVSNEKLSSKNLSNVLGISSGELVHNTLYNQQQAASYSQPSLAGVPVSFISPDGILLKDAEIEGINKPIKRDGVLLQNPAALPTK